MDIFRYVTEGTFDAFSYQLIESKQKFISQVMTGKSAARSAEDIDAAVLSYAQVKALCAGDPRIRERMDLETEVAQMNVLRTGFQSERYRLEDAVHTLLPGRIARQEGQVAACEAAVCVVTANPATTKEQFHMRVDGRDYVDRTEAGEAILAFDKTLTGTAPVALGSYRGFQMALRIEVDLWGVSTGAHSILLSCPDAGSYPVTLGPSAHGNTIRIDNTLEDLPALLDRGRAQLETLRRQLETAQVGLKQPWPREAEYQEKSTRLAELSIALNLDLAESAQGDTEQEPQQEDYEFEP